LQAATLTTSTIRAALALTTLHQRRDQSYYIMSKAILWMPNS